MALATDRQLRRLAERPSEADKVILQYRIPVRTPAERADLVAILQSAEFADDFGQQIISEEQARPQGLSISQLAFVRLSTKSTSFAGEGGNVTQKFSWEA